MNEAQQQKAHEKHAAACEAERTARQALEAAYKAYSDAVGARMRAELQVCQPGSELSLLTGHMRSNRARWSGGPYTLSNVVEAIQRDNAEELLPRWCR